jgi:hypothetical protein
MTGALAAAAAVIAVLVVFVFATAIVAAGCAALAVLAGVPRWVHRPGRRLPGFPRLGRAWNHAHPSSRTLGNPVSRPPGAPEDGEPLSFAEQRALSQVETDSWITVPEPVYGARS